MENDATPQTLPELDEFDVMAVEALLARTIRAQDQMVRDREEVTVINARIARNAEMRSGTYEALKIFGFTEPPEEDLNLWDSVREVLGAERYNRVIAIARGAEFPTLLTKMGDTQPPAKAVVEGVALGDTVDAEVVKRPVPVKAAVLEYVRSMGEQGVRAAQVRQHLAAAYGMTVHEKTPGMTLYRLLKNGLVRREGRIWYPVAAAENNENEAPNGEPEDASETALPAQ